ncbi:hypothetical protein HPB47_017912, partial [Ixodes persulcatus]
LSLSLDPPARSRRRRMRLRSETDLAMMETVEGTESDPEELNVPGQLYVSKKKEKAARLVDSEARHMERQRASEKLAGRKMVAKSVERQFARVPDGADQIVMRPHGDVCPDPGKVECRGCGMEKPPQNHLCEFKCQLCGRGQPLAEEEMGTQDQQATASATLEKAASRSDRRGESPRSFQGQARKRGLSRRKRLLPEAGGDHRGEAAAQPLALPHQGALRIQTRGEIEFQGPGERVHKKRSQSRDRKGVSFGSEVS